MGDEWVKIVRTPGVCAGAPRLNNTRWPTHTVLGWDYDREAMLRAYDHLTPAQIDAAIRYERSLRRRAGRFAMRTRRRLAAMVLGIDLEELEEAGL